MDKKLYFCSDELSQFAEFKPVCPEVGIGLPVPRAPIRQIPQGDVIKVSRADGSGDVTDALTTTLQHLQGYLKKKLSSEKRLELAQEILSFPDGLTPLLVPLASINHHLRDYPNHCLSAQTYLNPHPMELRLRYEY